MTAATPAPGPPPSARCMPDFGPDYSVPPPDCNHFPAGCRAPLGDGNLRLVYRTREVLKSNSSDPCLASEGHLPI
jgi:hypothetical protein